MSEDSKYRPRIPARSRNLRIRGLDYHVHEWGDEGQPLFVFLHGWGDSGLTFQFVVDELSGDWHVIAPDWRGFGRSEYRAEAYWFPDYLADLDALLSVYSPSEPARLVAHSMGANVAGLYAGVMPERVRAFVNVEGFGLMDSDPADAPERYREWIEKGREHEEFTAFEDIDALARHLLRKNPHLSLSRARFVARAWAQQSNGDVRLRADPAHKLPNAVLYRRSEAEACWRAATAPVLFVLGAESRLLDAIQAAVGDATPASDLAPQFPDLKKLVVDDAGHMIHFEAPAALARAIESFLGPTL
jgi:pimeloyl-ACP methyl ester carboxylesterase